LKNSNRWWESYLVRYLAGNIFAVFVVFYLFVNHGNKIAEQFCSTDFSHQYSICKNDESNNSNFTKEVFSLVFKKVETTKTTTEITFVSLLVMVVFGFLYMYISSIPIYFTHIFRFGGSTFKEYKKSASMRDKIKKKKKHYSYDISPTYIESYKHAREHGNAFGIILMEMLFALYLICTDFSIYGLVLWLSFGFSGWFLGIWLEKKMIDETYSGLWFTFPIFLFLVFIIGVFFLSTMMRCMN